MTNLTSGEILTLLRLKQKTPFLEIVTGTDKPVDEMMGRG